MDSALLRSFLSALYNDFRTARMNQIYYGERLARQKRRNFCLELMIAIGTSGTSVSAWPLWQTNGGRLAWASLAGLSTVLAIIKPLLGWTDEIGRLSRLFAGHGEVAFDLDRVIHKVRQETCVTPEIEGTVDAARERMGKLSPDDDPRPDEKIRRVAFDQVNCEIPQSSLWMPK